MKKLLFAIVAAVATLYSAVAMARPLTLNEISEATCRVRCGSASGTGTCIAETPDGQSYYVLTNAHVVGGSSRGTLEFFKGGHVTEKLPARVVWKQYRRGSDVDFALMVVSKSLFGEHQPRVIPLAPQGYEPQTGYYIAAVGCPSARWAQGWEGHIINRGASRVMFVPPPIGGQSGSGVTVLIQGRDGQWYTRVGAVLTWRITSGGLTQGGAIPVSTLYNILANSHVPYMTPASYQEVADVDDESGYRRVYPNQPSYGSCPPGSGSCPPGSGSCPPRAGGSAPWRTQPPAEQPPPQQPSPGVPPYTQPNPYGNANPPSIGAPWPGQEAPAEPEEEPEEDAEPTPEERLLDLADKYDALEKEKAALEEQIIAAEEDRLAAEAEAAAAAEAEADAELNWFQRQMKKLNGFVGGALMAFGIGVLIFIWNKFIKKRVIKRVDSLQDYLEGKISSKWGKDLAGEAREVMEGVEEALLGFADDFLEDIQARKRIAKSMAKGKPAERVTNGSAVRRKVNVSEILEAVRQASQEVGDDAVTTEVPKKVDEILNRVAQTKG